MFTGIIEETGIVRSFNHHNLTIQCSKILDDVKIGDSVAVNGVCLTVTGIHDVNLVFHVSPTTSGLSLFNPKDMKNGMKVNLERALRLDTRLGGHIVSGHVDGVSRLIRKDRQGEDYFMEFLYDPSLKGMIIPKGSITVDGISLTVSEVLSSSFVVTVIPQTYQDTNLHVKSTGDLFHIEVDLFARYIAYILKNGGTYVNNEGFIKKFF